MLEFEPYSIDALNRALPYIHKNATLASDYSAGYLFMWQKSNAVSFCFWNNTCIIRQNIGEQATFSWPMGEHPDEMLNELLIYVREHPSRSALEELELKQTMELLDVYEPLGLFAACMEYDHTIIALSIGELIGDTLIIHVEKALTKFEGIYPTMYQGFVQLVAGQIGYPLRYVNREDDSGDPGLRTSKTQYPPVEMLHKYLVHVNSPGALLTEYPVLKSDALFITEFRDTDKQNYFTLNTDIENNRFWGYDYREDMGITTPVDENSVE